MTWDGWAVYRQATWRYLAGDLISRVTLRTGRLERFLHRLHPLEEPLGVRMDLWLFTFQRKGRVPVVEWTQPGAWPGDPQ